MTTTPEELEKRLAALEQEVTQLRAAGRLLARELRLEGEVSTAEDGEDDDAFVAGWVRAMQEIEKQIGPLPPPVGVEKLQEMMRRRDGIRPNRRVPARAMPYAVSCRFGAAPAMLQPSDGPSTGTPCRTSW